MSQPFGYSITSDEVVEDLSFFDDWEDRYRFIIDLGKQLPKMDESAKTEDKLVRGCQSQVWLDAELKENRLEFSVDSDAVIVRGLLAMVMCAYNHKTPQDILAFDIEQYFDAVDLVKHLSPSRGNGLRAMIERIKGIAKEYSTSS